MKELILLLTPSETHMKPSFSRIAMRHFTLFQSMHLTSTGQNIYKNYINFLQIVSQKSMLKNLGKVKVNINT
ncbi:hypothetical protein AQD72_18905 [Klebsiella pneumoniae]|nr:hypothetical protein AQD71_07235 [Klebsiella pneumoniae]OJE68135.1 hypothetical protein AQD72_18905 [Klebsiella pneumoniae]OJE69461.1 hypothetical protein AQD70_13640 [Klebsiella pneumoniae]OJE73399.1 hypothetical protein AQD74_17785 [Klebsiella pneumoniae]OJE81486.1 hypothetical protein AQD76_16355 [Klebsiella pneumoniae]